MSTATAIRPASDKQIALLNRLAGERDFDVPAIHQIIADANAGTASMSAASRAIDILFDKPRKPLVHGDGAPVGEGYYLQEDTVYKVVKAKSTGNLYAKALHSTEYGRASWDYAPGAMKHLTGAHRLTLDQAREMGTRLGACVICGKALTDPESVERGIGPVCAARI